MTEVPYTIVSCDGHVHPDLGRDYRQYCPAAYLDEFDAFASAHAPETRTIEDNVFQLGFGAEMPEAVQRMFMDRGETPGFHDIGSRLADLDAQGIAAEVLFHGGGSFGPIPFSTSSPELKSVGVRMYNRWLADFVAQAPDRFVGVAQLPFWDLDATLEEVRWASNAGLRSVNFPAPRSELPDYADPYWDPFWAVCQDHSLPLNCHSGSGEYPTSSGKIAPAIFLAQVHAHSQRGLPYLIFGGVFDRFPDLKFVFTEQRGGWVGAKLRNLDSVYRHPNSGAHTYLKKIPSEYWASNCYLGNSFMAHFEAEMRYEVGVDRIMWGADYPHVEGTWPWTRESLRFTFAGLPHDEVAAMLGANAIACYGLDEAKLGVIAARIGPTPSEVDQKLDEVPEDAHAYPTMGFHEIGEFA